MQLEETLVPIGEVARRFGVAVSTLRYYDELGLLEPAERRGSGRHYGNPQLERLALIQMLQGGELTLEEIAALLAGPDSGRTWGEVRRPPRRARPADRAHGVCPGDPGPHAGVPRRRPGPRVPLPGGRRQGTRHRRDARVTRTSRRW